MGTSPYRSRWAAVPVAVTSQALAARGPARSGFGRRSDRKRVSHPGPPERPARLEVLHAAVPRVERDAPGARTRALGRPPAARGSGRSWPARRLPCRTGGPSALLRVSRTAGGGRRRRHRSVSRPIPFTTPWCLARPRAAGRVHRPRVRLSPGPSRPATGTPSPRRASGSTSAHRAGSASPRRQELRNSYHSRFGVPQTRRPGRPRVVYTLPFSKCLSHRWWCPARIPMRSAAGVHGPERLRLPSCDASTPSPD